MALVSGRRNEFRETPETLCPASKERNIQTGNGKRETGRRFPWGLIGKVAMEEIVPPSRSYLASFGLHDRGLEDNVSLHMAQWQKWYRLIHGGDSGNHR